MMVTVERWSDWQCNGGRALGSVRVVSGTWGVNLDGSDSCDLVIRPTARGDVSLRDVLRITDTLGDVYEYRVQQISKTMNDGRRSIKGLSPLADLGTSGIVRTVTGGISHYDVGGMLYPSSFLSGIILTNLAEDGLSWISLGNVDVSTVVTLIAPVSGWTHLQWLRALADACGGELRLRRNGSTDYKVDLLAATGSTAPTIRVARGKNLIDAQINQDDGELASAITPLGATVDGLPMTIGENAWQLGTIPGSAPYWIPLTDPEGGAAPIVFDDQVNNYYLLTDSATTVQITDSRASDSAVLVSATTGLVAGAIVQIVKNTSADRLTELRNPAVSRLHRVDVTEALSGTRNLIVNGGFSSWASLSSPNNWTMLSSAKLLKFARDNRVTVDPGTYMVIDGNQSAGVSTLNLKGGNPGDRFYYGEAFKVNGGTDPYVVLDDVVECDGAGKVTVTLGYVSGLSALTLANAVTDGAATSGWFYVGPKRPSVLPTGAVSTYAARFKLSGSANSTPITIKYVAGLPYVRMAASYTVVPDVNTVNSVPYLPSVSLIAHPAGTVLSTADCSAIVPLTAYASYNITLSCEYMITADTTLKGQISGGNAIGTLGWRNATVCHVAMVYLAAGSGGTLPNPVAYSSVNALWQRGNRALLARALVANQIRISLLDLSTLAGYSITRERVTLGGKVYLEDLGLTVRVIGILFDAENPLHIELIIDSRPTRLATLFAEKL